MSLATHKIPLDASLYHSRQRGGGLVRIAWLGLLIVVVLAMSAPVAMAKEPHVVDATVRSFVEQHCIDCHGTDIHKGGFRFDQLPNDLDDLDTVAQWVKVLDKVSSGQMPPAKKTQPVKKDVQAFALALTRKLHAASLSHQRQQGRVVLRRLNRNEYETTLRDLLGYQVSIKDLLPDDGMAAGFDNVSEALDVSSVHLLRYQDAAEKAVRSVIPSQLPKPFKDRRTGRQIVEKSRTLKTHVDKGFRFEGDKLVTFIRFYGSISCDTAQVTQPGRYRVRASVSSVNTGGKSLPVVLSAHGYKRRVDVSEYKVHDVPPNQTVVISDTFALQSREKVQLAGWDLPTPRELARRKVLPLKDYKGPGLVIDWIEIEGSTEKFPSAGYQRLFGKLPLKRKVAWNPNSLECISENPRKDADRLIRSLLPVAFRRPVGEALAKYFVGIAHGQLDDGHSFQEAMTVAYTAIFCSPHFLYLTEPLHESKPDRQTRLDDFAVASRLSYFLWSSLPDAELFELASKGQLRQQDTLHAQVERMLDDPKAQRFKVNFAGQWLALRDINATSPDPRIYGEFDEFLFWSMPRETQMFFNEVLSRDLPVTNFVHSDWTFLNQRLAQHYGIKGVSGGELRKVTLPADAHRGGVLTQAAIMKVTADGSKTSPVLRGAWVLDRILGHKSPPPPSSVADFEPDVRGTTTIRQQLDKHRNIQSCAVCHKHIDPPGFALESFDPIGGWREFYRGTSRTRVELTNYPGRSVPRGPDVKSNGRTADGKEFHNIDDYKQLLLTDKDQLARNLATKLIIFSTGADVQFADREVIEQLVAKSRADGYGFRSLVHNVVLSRPFLNK